MEEKTGLTSFSAHLKDERWARVGINVLLWRFANIPTSLPPQTSGSDHGRQQECERDSYWLA